MSTAGSHLFALLPGDMASKVKIKDGLYYHGPALADILERVRGWFTTHDNLDVGGLKELLGLSRKYLIALLEYMDNERITVRVGDQRRFRGR